ncbi:MAG: formate dehydrogenase accessory protein FdhE [Oryzomonas sp.]|uniref:formate dehydrogenase accessory protein FdhE n=1 Tax=Oryzomonas sp. TaxID=2855186 RepID=UPI00283F7C76|nr:formate dehydrogenase accessory protein FdhE [Oryzomonas sp.]MDR3578374.1 formate dehydrogenase accessory protein FdhE [Oryzomonas sp.]
MNTEDRILEPGRIEAPFGEIRFLSLAGRDLFTRRADRFRFLSPGHPLGKYLDFLALLADAQQEAQDRFPSLPPPDARELALCREHGMPLLDTRSRLRNPAWRTALTLILRRMSEADLPKAARKTAAGLMSVDENRLEEMADGILSGDPAATPPKELPFIAAALQVYWVRMASMVGEDAFAKLEPAGVCPVCGSFPATGIVHANGTEKGLRYLCCSLCASRWHMVRVKCSNCEATQGISYYSLEGSNGAVKAESCDDCNTYLKLLYLGKDDAMEAMADDLATLSLDMLMDKAGKARSGPNLFFHPGCEAKQA